MGKRLKPGRPTLVGLYQLKDALNAAPGAIAPAFDGKISRILVAPPDSLGKRLRATLRVIDTVHSIGETSVRKIPIVPIRRGYALGELVYHLGTGELLRLEIDARNEQIEFTLLHEVGHFLDFAAIPGSNFGRRRFDVDRYLDRVMTAALASRCVSHLKALSRAATTPEQKAASVYLLDPKEIWARAYAQFIATRGNDPMLLEFLNRRRSPDNPNPIQWTEVDFVPIAKATESLFRELRWIS